MSTTDALPVVGWIREWSFNGEEKGSEITDDEALCRRDVDSSGGVMGPLCKVSDALAALAAASAAMQPLKNDVHSCSFFCNLPNCIKTQRDLLRDQITKDAK